MKTTKPSKPTVRLAVTQKGLNGGASSVRHHVEDCGLGQVGSRRSASPTVRLAHVDGAQGDCILKGERGVARLSNLNRPALLISYVYLKPFLAEQAKYNYRDWVMDSGAFSAFSSGTTIELSSYIDTCRHLIATDPTLTEVFALDVIGDWQASEQNCERMWDEGIPAIPCYHYGEPEDVLMRMAARYPKIAIGGCAKMRTVHKRAFAEAVFQRVWPKKIHGFGFGDEATILALPFHSVDATSWEIGPCGFGSWRTFGKMSVRGSNQNLTKEVEHYLRVEEKARVRWKKEMALLEGSADAPTVRLASIGTTRPGVGAALRGDASFVKMTRRAKPTKK